MKLLQPTNCKRSHSEGIISHLASKDWVAAVCFLGKLGNINVRVSAGGRDYIVYDIITPSLCP